MPKRRIGAALVLAILILAPAVPAQPAETVGDAVDRETGWIRAEADRTDAPPLVETILADLPQGLPGWIGALVEVVDRIDPGWLDDGRIDEEEIAAVEAFVNAVLDAPGQAIADGVERSERLYFDGVHTSGEAAEEGLDTGASTYHLLDREATGAQRRGYGLAWETGGAVWRQLQPVVDPVDARVERVWSGLREGDRLIEPDRHGAVGLGDLWEEALCRGQGLGSIQPDADDRCDLYDELSDVADCANQAPTDFDCDGLDLVEEFCWGTHPLDADTDDDGWEDGPESVHWDDGDDECTAQHPDQVTTDDGARSRDEEATHDTDGDGTPNILDADSDGDHLDDGDEHGRDYPAARDGTQSTAPAANTYNDAYGNAPTDPAEVDTDGDGLTDHEELCDRRDRGDGDCAQPEGPVDGWGTDPNDADTDDDGASDRREAIYWTTGDRTWYGDVDADGVPNRLRDPDSDGDSWPGTANADDGVEMTGEPRTEAGDWDTDGDAMPDGFERHHDGLEPVAADGDEDADGDGLSNGAEYRGVEPVVAGTGQGRRPDGYDETTRGPWTKGLDPSRADMDGDGILDGDEVRGGLNRWKEHRYYEGDGRGGSTNVADPDTDGDRLGDRREILEGSDPNVACSVQGDVDGLDECTEILGWNVTVDGETSRVTSDPGDRDTDGDGVDDGDEHRHGTYPDDRSGDSDGDGLSDAVEIHGSASPCDPTSPDTDGDGFDDLAEQRELGTACHREDTDGDGLGDAFEVEETWRIDAVVRDDAGAGSPIDCSDRTVSRTRSSDAVRRDTDGDGLSDAREYVLRTDPGDADTDGDGVADDHEASRASAPTHWDSDGDCQADGADPQPASDDHDGDGLSNAEEGRIGSDPGDPDTDGDGLGDGAERRAFSSDPLHADTDGDTMRDAYDPHPRRDSVPPNVTVIRPVTVLRYPERSFWPDCHDRGCAEWRTGFRQGFEILVGEQSDFTLLHPDDDRDRRTAEAPVEFKGFVGNGVWCDARPPVGLSVEREPIDAVGGDPYAQAARITVTFDRRLHPDCTGYRFKVADEYGNNATVDLTLTPTGCVRQGWTDLVVPYVSTETGSVGTRAGARRAGASAGPAKVAGAATELAIKMGFAYGSGGLERVKQTAAPYAAESAATAASSTLGVVSDLLVIGTYDPDRVVCDGETPTLDRAPHLSGTATSTVVDRDDGSIVLYEGFVEQAQVGQETHVRGLGMARLRHDDPGLGEREVAGILRDPVGIVDPVGPERVFVGRDDRGGCHRVTVVRGFVVTAEPAETC